MPYPIGPDSTGPNSIHPHSPPDARVHAAGTEHGIPPPDPRGALIESIYRIALEPMSYDRFMGHWDDYISARLAALGALSAPAQDVGSSVPADPEIASHLDIATRLIERTAALHPGTALRDSRGDPRMLIAPSGRIVWTNAAAHRLFDLPRHATVKSLDLPVPQAEGLRQALAGLATATPDAPGISPLVLRIGAPGAGRPVDMAARVIHSPEGATLALEVIAPHWHGAMAQILAEAFALSPGEAAICALVADGLGPADIATRRAAALGTVRTQLKSIYAKTRCAGQADLVRLLHALLRVAEEHDATLGKAGAAPPPGVHTIRVSDRDMPVEEHGPQDGWPVIFLHGMLDGNAVTRACRAQLRAANIRLICPVRPSFGTAAPSPGPIATAPDRLARDIQRLISAMRLDRPVLLGHMAGSVYAFAAAAAAPVGQIRGLVSVSGGVPIRSPAQFAAMSARQRLVAWTARYAPSVLPFVLRAGIRQLRSGGERKFLHSLYESAPRDMAVIADPEIADIVLDGYRFTVAQGHSAFEIDSHQVVRDWSPLVAASDVPVHLVHGAHDPVVSLESVRAFHAEHAARARLTVLEDTGQLVLYRRPEVVIDALTAFFGS